MGHDDNPDQSLGERVVPSPTPRAWDIALRDTRSMAYAVRLGTGRSRWRRWLGVQLPYRWNLRRLKPGFVLDLGCGIGRNLIHLDGQGIGVDHNPHAVAEARERGLTAYSPEDFAASEWCRPGAFDSILIAHVLEHLDEPTGRELVGRYLENLRPDGRVIVIVPQQLGFRSDPSHVRYLDQEAIRALFHRLGISVDRAYSFPFPWVVGRVFRFNETVVIGRLRPGSRP